MHSRSALVASLRELGVRAGDIVMLHASLRAVGKVIGGPDQVHVAVEEAASPGGTVMMFVGAPEGYDDVGRGIYTREEEAELLAHQPPFDPSSTRASHPFGALAELFRSFPGTICSGSPCGRMAARGARAVWITENQPWTYGLGRGSPLEKLCEAGGKVLLLGSSRDEVTLLHYAEHDAEFPNKRIARYKVPMIRHGERVWVDCEEFDTSNGAHESWPSDFFAQIVTSFIDRNRGTKICSVGKVGNAEATLIDAAALIAHAIPMMVDQATSAG